MKIKIIRSWKRKKTIGVREISGLIHLYLPADLSKKEEVRFIQWAKKRIKSQKKKRKLREKNADLDLEKRAKKFNMKYFDGELSWRKIGYSTKQNNYMFGNCNTKNKTIRISDRLLKMPKFVRDYVLIHELAHLKILKHGPKFRRLVNRYPKTERARGYLMAIAMND